MTELEKVQSLLCRLYMATFVREGWEDGDSTAEVQQEAGDYLSNHDLDPHVRRDRVRIMAAIFHEPLPKPHWMARGKIKKRSKS